jgi:hypothetical protein
VNRLPVNVPLHPDELRRIESVLDEIDDPPRRSALRRKMVASAQKAANADALDRRRYRDELTEATASGAADPKGVASARVTAAKVMDEHDARVRATFRRVSARSARRFDKAAVRVEKASKSAKPALRRMPQKDRKYVDILGEAEKQGYLADHPLVLSIINSKMTRYRLPHWQKTTSPLKVMALAIEKSAHGRRIADSVRSALEPARHLIGPQGPERRKTSPTRDIFSPACPAQALVKGPRSNSTCKGGGYCDAQGSVDCGMPWQI